MIVAEIRLQSARGASRNRKLGVVLIANDGSSNDGRVGHYTVAASRGPRGKVYEARVENFPRHSRSALELLRRALNAIHDAGGLP
jgi:hypothetical protein